MKRYKDLGIIDPTNMDKRQQHVLYEWFLQNPDEIAIKRNISLSVYYAKNNTQYTFKLSNKIVHDVTREKFSENIFSVLSTETAGKGSFGSVCKVLMELKPQAHHHRFKKTIKKHKGFKEIKQSAYDGDKSHFKLINREIALAKQTPHLKFSRHVYFKDPHGAGLYTNYIRMQFFDGENLKKLLKKELNDEQRLVLAINVARALRYQYHIWGIIHRDFKPKNIMIDSDSEAYIVDIGLGKIIGQKTYERVGTLGYMSSEQKKGRSTTVLSDVSSLGYTCLKIWRAKLKEKNSYHQELKYLFTIMVNHNPKKRPSLDEVIHQLEGIQLKMRLAAAMPSCHASIKEDHAAEIIKKDEKEQKIIERKRRENQKKEISAMQKEDMRVRVIPRI